MKPLLRARRVFDIEIASLKAVRRQLDHSFESAIAVLQELIRHKGKLLIAGIGKSGNIGKKIAATFTSTGCPSVLLNTVDALHGDLGMVSDGDVILALSYSGESEELLNLLPYLKRYSVKIIAITGNRQSSLALASDLVLRVKVPKEACPFNLAPTSSTTCMLVLGDALAMALLEARGFNEQDYAKHHPSGAIGRTLLLRVHEIMRSGDRVAVAPETVMVRDALLAMTRAKCGSVIVVKASGKLAGVFTDGDLRRRMADDEDLLGKPLKSVMTRHPACIRDTALAVDALKIFKERNIDDLIVINDRKEPVGLVDSQDLPKLKLM